MTTIFPRPTADVQVTITGIPPGVKKVLLEHYRIDRHAQQFLHCLAGDGFTTVADP